MAGEPHNLSASTLFTPAAAPAPLPAVLPLPPLTDHQQTAKPGLLYPPTQLEESFRHSHWASRRKRVMEALDRATVPSARRVAFADCGCCGYIELHDETSQPRYRCTKCHDRFCQACQEERARVIAHQLRERVEASRTLHVVLTLRSSPAPLKNQLDRLYKSAAKLRQTRWWKLECTGGSATLELTRNPTTKEWHPHLHLLCHAGWIDQAKLSSEWLRITGDSHVVHVSLVRRDDAAVREVTKYLAKPLHRSVEYDAQALDELIPALRGRRMIVTFGSWRGKPLTPTPPEGESAHWTIWGSWGRLCELAARGDAWAERVRQELLSHRPGASRLHHAPPRSSPARSHAHQPAAP